VKLPSLRKYPAWHHPEVPNNQIGVVLMLCRHLLNHISPGNHWSARIDHHFNEFPEIPMKEMGLPADWQNQPLWKS
jgi:hypothetical protein